MNTPALIIIIIFLVILSLPILISLKSRRNLRRYIEKTFGKAPENTDYDLKSIESYRHYYKNHNDTSKQIDDITWNDLNMDDVYKRINRCCSSVGEEYLFEALHEISFDGESTQKLEKLTAYFDKHPEERKAVQISLLRLGKHDYNRLSSFIFEPDSKKLKHGYIYTALAAVPLLAGALAFISTQIGLALLVGSVVVNTIIYFKLKLSIERELYVIRYFSSMLYACGHVLKKSDEELKQLLCELEKNYKVFKPIKGKVPASAHKSADPIAFLAEYYKMIFLSDIRKYNRIISNIIANKEAFHALYRAFGELDAAISVLSFRQSLPFFCLPEFAEESKVEFSGLYHPLVVNPVTNDGVITGNSIVTGPNASGKSTFIKALAVNAILAQTIKTCAAEKFALRHSLVMTSMAVRDDILEGESYFITEIKSLKRVLDMTEKVPCICFIDEILRGTNTIERIAASSSIMRHLTKTDCLCMVASHDIELTRIMDKYYDNYHFSEKVDSEGVSFDFKLRNGAANTKNAIKLLGFMSYDEEIVNQANDSVEDFLNSGVWKVIS